MGAGTRAEKRWVGTAVYTTLNLLNQLIGMEGVDEALGRLRPSPLRPRLLRRYVTRNQQLRRVK